MIDVRKARRSRSAGATRVARLGNIANEWFPVARATELKRGQWLSCELLEERWVLACDNDGRIEVFVDTCPHRGAQLTLGDFDGKHLRCGYHGWQFNMSGHCIYQPAHLSRTPPRSIRLGSASVRRGYGFLWLCVGDAPRDLPVAPDHRAYPDRTVWLDPVTVRSSGPRIIENFLDLAHFPFVHEGYLGQEPHTEVQRYKVEIDETQLTLSGCSVWQPDPGPATASGAVVSYDYSVSHPYAATLTKVPTLASVSESVARGELSVDQPTGGFTILIVASPVNETCCVVWRATVVHDEGVDLDAQRAFNELIFSQDIDIVESQRPRCLPVDTSMEFHQPADTGSLAYRRWLRSRGIGYGTIGDVNLSPSSSGVKEKQ